MEPEIERQLAEIAELRRQGLLTQSEAYERHMALVTARREPAPAGPQPPRPAMPPLLASPTLQMPRAAAATPQTATPASIVDDVRNDLFAVAVTVVGCVVAIVGVFFQEAQSGLGLLGAVIAAPLIEESLKPAGIYVLLIRWPQRIRSRGHSAVLGAFAGATFGLIESFIYVTFYFPDQGDSYVAFRFTVPVLMHVVCSSIVGFGLSRALIDWANGLSPFPRRTRNFFLAGMGIHGAYNALAIVLELTDVLSFD